MKRVFILFLCLFLLFTCVFSVSAESFSGSPYNVVELLNSDYYEVSCQDGSGIWMNSQYDNARLYTSGSTWARFTWDVALLDVGFKSVYLTFSCDNHSIKSVYLKTDLYQGTDIAGTLVSTGSSDSKIYQYRFDVNERVLSKVSILINFHSNASTYTKLLSLKGFKDESISITNASFSNFVLYSYADKLRNDNVSYGSAAPFPILHHMEGTGTNWYSSRCFLYINHDQRKVRDPDQIVVFFNTIDYPTLSVGLVNTSDNNNVVTTLPFSVSLCDTRRNYSYYDPNDSYKWPIDQYMLVIDTSGYDLAGYNIQICAELLPFIEESGEMFLFEWDSAFSVPPVADLPWYRVFFGWISDKYDMLGQKLDNILTALDPKDSEFDKAQEEAKQKADEIDDMNKFMETLPKFDPSASDIDFDMEQYLLPASVTVNSGLVMTSILGDKSWVLTMITLVFTMSLVGYIFFGKR